MSFLRRIFGDRGRQSLPAQSPDRAGIYNGLRGAILGADPESVGIKPTAELPNVWGIVMDWSVGSGMATIVSLADGTTSLYLSSGGGTIGAGAHQAPAAASLRALRIAETAAAEIAPTQTSPLPAAGGTALTLLTFAGHRRIEANTGELLASGSAASQVAIAMQEVIYAIRTTQATSSTKPLRGDEPS